MTNLLHRNDNCVTAHNKCSKTHRQPQSTLQILCEDSVLNFTLLYAGSSIKKCERAIRLV
jgi:hypothetical protein